MGEEEKSWERALMQKKRKAYYNHSKVILKANSSKVKSFSFPHYDSDELMLEHFARLYVFQLCLFLPTATTSQCCLTCENSNIRKNSLSLPCEEFYFRSSSRLLELRLSIRGAMMVRTKKRIRSRYYIVFDFFFIFDKFSLFSLSSKKKTIKISACSEFCIHLRVKELRRREKKVFYVSAVLIDLEATHKKEESWDWHPFQMESLFVFFSI